MNELSVKKLHTISLEARKKCTMQGVTRVTSYGENELCLDTGEGRLIVLGKGIKIEGFDEESGELRFSGEVSSLKYAAAKLPLIKRIFK